MLGRRSTQRFAALLACAISVTGCKRGHEGSGPSPSPSAIASASASGGAGPIKPASSVTPTAAGAKPTGSGVSEFAAAMKTPECKAQSAEMATYLLRGELAIAARESQVAAVWLVQLPNRPSAQIAFA